VSSNLRVTRVCAVPYLRRHIDLLRTASAACRG
jgi:hypothetical protein